jgi:hypothetical protein
VIVSDVVYQAILRVPINTSPPNGTYWEALASPPPGPEDGVFSSLAVSGNVGFNGETPADPEAYTLTFDTPARTLAAATAVNVVTTAPALTSYGYTQAQAAAVLTAINALVADNLNLREMIAGLVTDLAAAGIVTT